MLQKSILIIATILTIACATRVPAQSSSADVADNPSANIIQTRIGVLEFSHDFENGYPSKKTVNRLYDEIDFQRACQAYLWALPLVSFSQWQLAHEEVFNAKDGDFVIYNSFRSKLGILTANATTPYVFAFGNLKHTGPMVLETQPGPNASGIATIWQKSIVDVGAMGQDKNQGGKYLIVPPGNEMEDVEGYYMVRMPTQNYAVGIRSLDPDSERGMAWIHSLKLYPYENRDNPAPNKFIEAGNKEWDHVPPRGMAFWENLSKTVNSEIVRPTDRIMMAMLKPLGIEKGKPFVPDERQTKILEQAVQVGEAMAKAMTYDKRFEGARYRPDTQWKYIIFWNWTHEGEFHYQFDELAAFTYEAVGTNRGMSTQTPGVGQAYLAAYKDADGDWLDGGKSYRLRVPADVPMKEFWSVTVYDVDTRCLIKNKQEIVDRSSRMELLKNDDGSIDLYFGPQAPKGKEANWIPTVSGKGWFTYFRLYAPTEPYFDKTWALPDVEKMDLQ